MGSAMLKGWLEAGHKPSDFIVVDPFLSEEMSTLLDRYHISHFEEVPRGIKPSLFIIAVKPQMMEKVLPDVKEKVAGNPVYISIAAGTTLQVFQKLLGEEGRFVRAMPNTPAQVGRGITIGYGTCNIDEETRCSIAKLLDVTGAFEWVQEEVLIDAVTALSGSGPAYIFHMVEAMAKAGQELGLSDELAMLLARKTVEGAGELLFQSDLEAATLRENVTSPGGTTQAALSILMDKEQGLEYLMKKTLQAAKKRAEELSSQS